jgi:tRNA (adenine22-N1)-methyltransferase
MEKYKIADLRLAAAASFGRKGKMVADIGTDHASLPIFLVGNGIADSALACDINIGPLNAAKKNIEAAGLADKINTKLTDGLNGIEDFNPEDIYILGMGGELIWRIINDSDLPRNIGVRLVLQPMTHAHDLRRGLYDNGFNIVEEALVRDRDRVYQIIVAEYDGVVRSASESELWLGKHNIERGGEELAELASLYASGLEKKIKGYASAGKTDTEASSLYEAFRNIVKNGK